MKFQRVTTEYSDPKPPHEIGEMPDPKYWGDMSISQRVREVKVDIDKIWKSLGISFLVAVGFSILGFFMSPFFRPLELFFWVLPFFGAWITYSSVRVVLSGDLSLLNILETVLLLPSLVLGGLLLGEILGRRQPTVYLLGIVALVFVAYSAGVLLMFYRDWLATDPRMSESDCKDLRRMDVEPNYFLLSGIILLAMVGPFTSLWISISGAIGLISWGLFSGRKDLESLKTFKERIREMLGLAFNYPV
ncbi:MAG: hypothetical protein KC994_25670, partial [Candidatus Omnitrophica bacterium]|nr:hypothetical protein [Candidatus Omnitrophota bacterium]